MKKEIRMAVGGIITLVILVGFFSTLIQIQPGQVAVVTRFGKVTGRELSEGLNVKLPFPVEQVWVADIRVQKEEATTAAATSDLQNVDAKLAVNYRIRRDAVAELYRTVGPQFKSRVIDPAIQEVFKATTAQYTASQLLGSRAEVKERSKKALVERLDPYGIEVDDISIVNFQFGEEFNRAIEQKQVAQQEAERAGYLVERARNEAQAQELLRQSLTKEVLTKQAIEKWDGKMPLYVGGEGSVFSIPLQAE